MTSTFKRINAFLFAVISTSMLVASSAYAEISGMIDVRLVSADDTPTWPYEGLGKQRFDSEHDGIKLGQAVVDIKGNLTDTITGKLSFNGYDDRSGFADITEAYLQWKPLPFETYQIKVKLGAFYPAISLENNGVGWTNLWMLSTSAINTWVGEELRTIGSEFSWKLPGQLNNSPHDFELTYALFTANDPATSLIAWRGWSVGDRITGLTERLPLPYMPDVYGPNSIFNSQESYEKAFVEIDHHYGYQIGANYGYNNWISVRAFHYDNRGNPTGMHDGQWSWLTTFDHLSLKIDFENNFSLLAQAMRGNTRWGIPGYGVNASYDSWYLLGSQSIGAHRFSVRYDKFNMRDKDHMLGDDNSEDGHSIAATWLFTINNENQVGLEYLKILSTRSGREYLNGLEDEEAGEEPVTENTLQLFYRYKF
ncbi:MAG: hypothetical protein EOO53_14795 [Gammaproteobacteria bacterium]|nr:MAG: hypothetical protein EOO53_14795 [Gammaproteobacteria bacterium]